jgi:hypothetical protein
MATGIPSEAFSVLCLLLADGDLDASALRVVLHAERWQDEQDRHFGISRSDFRGAFREMAGIAGYDLGPDGSLEALLARTPITFWIPAFLEYGEVWFNDEGEGWIRTPPKPREIPCWLVDPNMTTAVFHRPRGQVLTDALEAEELSPPWLMRLNLHHNGYGDPTLEHYSRPGSSS